MKVKLLHQNDTVSSVPADDADVLYVPPRGNTIVIGRRQGALLTSNGTNVLAYVGISRRSTRTFAYDDGMQPNGVIKKTITQNSLNACH